MRKNITVHFGLRSVTLDFPMEATVGSVLADQRVQAALQCGTSVNALMDRVTQSPSSPLSDGEEIYLEQKASTKGA